MDHSPRPTPAKVETSEGTISSSSSHDRGRAFLVFLLRRRTVCWPSPSGGGRQNRHGSTFAESQTSGCECFRKVASNAVSTLGCSLGGYLPLTIRAAKPNGGMLLAPQKQPDVTLQTFEDLERGWAAGGFCSITPD